jgi:hypothetical protein
LQLRLCTETSAYSEIPGKKSYLPKRNTIPAEYRKSFTIASHSSERFTPFAHALFGGARSSSSVFGFSASETAFAMALGGGVDIGSRNLAFRIGQFDYLMTRFGGVRQNDFRYSAGIVFRFGK